MRVECIPLTFGLQYQGVHRAPVASRGAPRQLARRSRAGEVIVEIDLEHSAETVSPERSQEDYIRRRPGRSGLGVKW